MIYLSLFWEFLKIGMFAFGGAYGAIPLIQESVIARGWMDEAMFANVIVISESTPGPIMVNAATYVGNSQGGVLGAAVATLGVVLPSFLVTLLVAAFLYNWMRKNKVQAVIKGIKPCLMGVILATGIYMGITAIFGSRESYEVDWIAVSILAVLVILSGIYKYFSKKAFSPIALIIIAAIMGAVCY